MSQPTCHVCAKPTDAAICHDCTDQAVHAVKDLPSLIRELATVRARQTRVYKAGGRMHEPDQDWRGSEHALRQTVMPVDLDASALLTDTIALWQSYRWITSRAGAVAMRNRDDAADVHRVVMRGHRKALRAVDRSPSAFYAGPCHAMITEPVETLVNDTIYVQMITQRCERDLYAWPGSEGQIRCDGYRSDRPGDEGCRTLHSAADREKWLAAAVHESLVTIDELLAALPSLFPTYPQPPRSVALAWVRQGRLFVHGVRANADETFRGSDLLDLVEAYKPKRFATRRKAG